MPSRTYDYTGGWQRFTVPKDVEIINVTLDGAAASGQRGGWVYGRVRVKPGQTIHILVGQSGRPRSGTGNRIGGEPAVGGGGRGGDGSGSGQGGTGGAGATYIRRNKRDGPILAVAGGAGGTSGNGADGGEGGRDTGGLGGVTGGFPEVTEAATGGTQSQGGKGGTSALGVGFAGGHGGNRLSRAGKGGSNTGANNATGGGGGGGGYFPGGGGAAGRVGVASAGGGAGGSNFTGGMFSSSSRQGAGSAGHGSVRIQWDNPNAPNKPPVPPDNIRIDDKPISDGLATKAKGSVLLTGTPDDPNAKQGVRLYVRMSRNKKFSNFRTFRGTFDPVDKKDKVRLTNLKQDTRYYLRIYTQDKGGKISNNYRATNFWTNRRPTEPTLVAPVENAQFTTLVNVTFQWNHHDPDPADSQTAFRLRYRRAQTPLTPAGAWTTVEQTTNFDEWTIAGSTFRGNTLYEWQVRTRDEQNRWGVWSVPNTFYVISETTSPLLEWPTNSEAVVAAEDNLFRWRFRTPVQGTLQARADLRYRVVGSEFWSMPDQPEPGLWTTLTGDAVTPGGEWQWLIPADTFQPGFKYEWEVRTWAEGDGEPSDWSETERFWTTQAPESGEGLVLVDSGQPQRALGVGDNKVFIYDRGGQVIRGELTPVTLVRWNRRRDDISTCIVSMTGWDDATRGLLETLRTWQHEMVIFRDGERVWEGPITRISGDRHVLEVEAKDVMGYVYRRIMRQGYNDSYRIINGQQIGQTTVVERSTRIIMNALAYDDPNVLGYLTPLNADDDAKNSRVRPDYTRTAWEEVDDLAATAGLDYTCSGRRIILWDTHRPVGRLPEMRDGDFSEPPIVTEYGMSAANYFAVTNGNGIWGAATKVVDGDPGPTGYIEQLASAYGESESLGTERNLTREDRRRLAGVLEEQAVRNIEDRWPPPIVVRIPDNSTLNPELNLGVNQLIPGVWIPLRAEDTVRKVSQWQKLDSMQVEQTNEGERISVVMSPAPQAGDDPDADSALEEE